MIVDGHCHAWRVWPYDMNVPDPTSRGSIEALLYEMDSHGVERATVVCARIGGRAGGDGFSNDDNNEYVSAFARAHSDRIGAWVDVDCSWRPEYHQPEAARRLREELDRTGAHGFTHYLDETNDGWLRAEGGAEFFRTAADLGVIASIAPSGDDWFDDLTLVAQQNPTLPILLHHLGVRRGGNVDALTRCASTPNIGVKVSGFNYQSSKPWDFPFFDAMQLFRKIHHSFGARRLYWGSDFPASRDFLTYRQSIEVVRSRCDFLNEAEISLILGDNLADLLSNSRLDLPPTATSRADNEFPH